MGQILLQKVWEPGAGTEAPEAKGEAVSYVSKNQYKVQGRLSETVYARAKTLAGARAQLKRVAKSHFIDLSNLEIVGPMGKVVFEEE